MKSLLPHWEARGLNTAAGSAGEAEAAEPPCCAGDADGAGHGLPGSRVFTQTRRGPVSTQNPARQSLQQLYFGVFTGRCERRWPVSGDEDRSRRSLWKRGVGVLTVPEGGRGRRRGSRAAQAASRGAAEVRPRSPPWARLTLECFRNT
ncbi:unnamed protein product [Rangifer tarandus platyrhynchus]|uniref:Uncharacterized protein n=1 Tax=Rangifer tarandus platyrhynchus TaxID=3082113 RepID=A0ABN8XLM5_RANTA|nr:unnamed protein product [Rangifer tarandus platyrhynchus]CAI9689739.1 unnamed protein product [Rangifer tarandus platyrhynchus]